MQMLDIAVRMQAGARAATIFGKQGMLIAQLNAIKAALPRE
jgi:hypothetical protein